MSDNVASNRKEFLAQLREVCDYKGPDELASVKKFITDEGHVIDDGNGNAVDVDAIWAKSGGKRLTAKIETEDQTEDRLSGKSAERTAAPISKAARVDAGIAGKIGDKVSASKKAYDMRARNGDAAFSDADTAEACGAWLRAANAVVNGKTYSRLDEDLRICEKAGSGVNMTTGGALVPEDFRAQLIYLSENYGVVRRLFNVVPMTRDTATMPRQTGEFAFAFAGENGTLTDDTLDTDQVNLVAKKAYGLARLPSELMDDAAINVSDLYARGFAKGIAKLEDQCGLIGDGTSTYGGIVGVKNGIPSTALYYAGGASNSGKDTWAEIVEADVNAITGLVENADTSSCAFVCSRQFFFQVLKGLSTGSGRGTINEFLTVNGLGGKADAQWGGWPVYFSQVLPTATAVTTKSLYFGDFKAACMFGDRKELMVTTSDQRYFDSDQIAIRGIERFAINVHGDGRGSTYGPIVALATSTT
jgi:HK97 family phage major capsid protein